MHIASKNLDTFWYKGLKCAKCLSTAQTSPEIRGAGRRQGRGRGEGQGASSVRAEESQLTGLTPLLLLPFTSQTQGALLSSADPSSRLSALFSERPLAATPAAGQVPASPPAALTPPSSAHRSALAPTDSMRAMRPPTRLRGHTWVGGWDTRTHLSGKSL